MVPHSLMRLKLPHFPRIFTATIFPGVASGILWASLVMLVGLNLLLTKTRPLSYPDELFNVLTRPFSDLAHEKLATSLWHMGARANATRELAIAGELPPGDKVNVLGATTSPADLLRQWENAPKREAADLAYWQSVTVTHPEYRDAYVQMAALSYAGGNLIQTKEYLVRATALDPNGKMVRDLLAFITKQLE